MHFRVTTGNMEHGIGWHKELSRLQWKKIDEKLHGEIGLKVYMRLYRQKSTRRYWDYSETAKRAAMKYFLLTAQLCCPPWIWTLRMAATDWALSQRANAKRTSSAYSKQLHNHAVKHGGESATRHSSVCIKQPLTCLSFFISFLYVTGITQVEASVVLKHFPLITNKPELCWWSKWQNTFVMIYVYAILFIFHAQEFVPDFLTPW